MRKYEITKHIATLGVASSGVTLELNMIRWKGRAETYDLGRWDYTPDGERVMLKGVTLSQAEFDTLRDVLSRKEKAKGDD